MKNHRINFEITGMTCEHCASGINKLLKSKNGIKGVTVNFKEGKAEVEFNPDEINQNEIHQTVNATNIYKVKPDSNFFDLIIIGGGSAAFSAALKANELGLAILMVNGGLPIGGTCVNVGCVPSKHLIRAAESIHKASYSPFAGIKTNKPGWDYAKIIRDKKALVKEMQQKKYLDVVKDFETLTIVEGEASFIDEKTILVNNTQYSGIKFLIATGSKTSTPQIQGLENVNYLTNDSLFDLEDLPESLIILGGGYIGLEIAQAYKRFGSKVRIIEYAEHILPNQDSAIGGELAKYLTDEGIEITNGVKIENVSKKDSTILIKGLKNDSPVSFESTHLLITTGRKPNIEKLKPENAGIEILKSGHIKVNDFLQTNVNNIYAAGDVINSPAFVYTAAYEGNLAIENAFHGKEIKADYTAMPWVIFTDPQVAGVGIDEKKAAEKNIPFEVSTLSLNNIPRAIAALDTRGFIKLIRNPETDELLGARIIAPEGGELIMELSIAIKYKIKVSELAKAFHPYLTLSEGIKLAAVAFTKDVKKLSCCVS